MLSVPTSTAPAASNRSMSGESRSAGGSSRLIFEPARDGMPFTSNRFLTAKGTPAAAPGGSPLARRKSTRAAWRRARAAVTWVKALSEGLRLSMRPSTASMTAAAVISPRCTARAVPSADASARLIMSAQDRNTGAGSASSGSSKSATRAANFRIASRWERIIGCQSGSIGSASAKADAAMNSSSSSIIERSDKGCRIGYRAEHATLHLYHLDRVVVVAFVGRATTIFEQQALETAIVGFAHGGMHADVGGDAGEHDIFDPAQAQHQLEIGGAERALAGLVDDRLAVSRREIRNDIPPGLAAREDA